MAKDSSPMGNDLPLISPPQRNDVNLLGVASHHQSDLAEWDVIVVG